MVYLRFEMYLTMKCILYCDCVKLTCYNL